MLSNRLLCQLCIYNYHLFSIFLERFFLKMSIREPSIFKGYQCDVLTEYESVVNFCTFFQFRISRKHIKHHFVKIEKYSNDCLTKCFVFDDFKTSKGIHDFLSLKIFSCLYMLYYAYSFCIHICSYVSKSFLMSIRVMFFWNFLSTYLIFESYIIFLILALSGFYGKFRLIGILLENHLIAIGIFSDFQI